MAHVSERAIVHDVTHAAHPKAYDDRPPGLARARAQQGLTQAQLAADAGLARETVSRLEHGRVPALATALRLAAVLGLGLGRLFPVQGECDGPVAPGETRDPAEGPGRAGTAGDGGRHEQR
jgi:DNA-binding XRE family transcriptional regulator